MQESIVQAIADFDGTHTDSLKCVGSKAPSGQDVDWLIGCMQDDETVRTAGTWIIKAWVEHGHSLTQKQVTELVRLCTVHDGWEPQLHILQLLEYVDVTKQQSDILMPFLQTAVQSERTLVQAWALYGLGVVGSRHEAYREIAQDTLESAAGSAKGAVVVRVRKALALL